MNDYDILSDEEETDDEPEIIVEENPDIIAQLLTEMSTATQKSTEAYSKAKNAYSTAYSANDAVWDLVNNCQLMANGNYYSQNGITLADGATTITGGMYQNAHFLKTLEFSADITGIGDSAFYGCERLEAVGAVNPCSITSIGQSAFQNCEKLNEVNITTSSSVSIGDAAFKNCPGLITLYCDNATNIGVGAFEGCTQLETIRFPNIISVGKNAFEGTAWLNNQKQNSDLIKLGTVLIYAASSVSGQLTIPDGVKSITDELFKNNRSITGIVFPSGFTTIGNAAFSGCYGIRGSLDIPSGVLTIGDEAFKDCINLERITLPNTIESIGTDAFYNNSRVSSVTVEDNFNADLDLTPFRQLTASQLVTIFNALKDNIDADPKVITLGTTLQSKLTDDDIQIAINKNWDVA